MKMKTRHVITHVARSSYSASSYTLAKFILERHTLISRTLCGLACAPRTSLTPGCPVEKPAVSDATTGYGSFNLLSRRSFHFELRIEAASYDPGPPVGGCGFAIGSTICMRSKNIRRVCRGPSAVMLLIANAISSSFHAHLLLLYQNRREQMRLFCLATHTEAESPSVFLFAIGYRIRSANPG